MCCSMNYENKRSIFRLQNGGRMDSHYVNGRMRQVLPTTEPLEVEEPDYLPPSQMGPGPSWMSRRARVIVTVVLAVLALVSAFPVATHFSAPETYTSVNETLDSQKSTALGLVATATTASVAVSAIPDDVGTPIANQLADLSGKLAVVSPSSTSRSSSLPPLGSLPLGGSCPPGSSSCACGCGFAGGGAPAGFCLSGASSSWLWPWHL